MVAAEGTDSGNDELFERTGRYPSPAPQRKRLAKPREAVIGGNPLLGAERLEPARKGPRHFPQMFIIQHRVVAAQVAPPRAQPAAGLPQRKERVRHDAIRAVLSGGE